jgi:hypothetical protein
LARWVIGLIHSAFEGNILVVFHWKLIGLATFESNNKSQTSFIVHEKVFSDNGCITQERKKKKDYLARFSLFLKFPFSSFLFTINLLLATLRDPVCT